MGLDVTEGFNCVSGLLPVIPLSQMLNGSAGHPVPLGDRRVDYLEGEHRRFLTVNTTTVNPPAGKDRQFFVDGSTKGGLKRF